MIHHPGLDDVIFLKTVDSTNLEVKRRRKEFLGSNILVVSDEQTQGKGQKGRIWESAAGLGLWMSLHLGQEKALAQDLQLLSLYTGVVIHKILAPLVRSKVCLKWPNDILMDSRKCGGILTELQWQGERITSATIGVGINLSHTRQDFPAFLQNQATSLQLEGLEHPDCSRLINTFVNEFFDGFTSMDDGGQLAREWNSKAFKLGKLIQWENAEGIVKGVFSGINSRGDALINIDGELRAFHTGEIRLLKTD